MERLVSEKANLESELGRRPEALYAARVAAEDQPSIIHDQFISLHRNNLAYTKLKEVEAALDRLISHRIAQPDIGWAADVFRICDCRERESNLLV
jgi:hypothetical protein